MNRDAMDPAALAEHVRQVIGAQRLIRPGERVIVGVSGGPDSVALLHLLVGLQRPLRLHLRVLHVDHGLRPDSAADARFVEELAAHVRVPAQVVSCDVTGESRRWGWSLEDAARRLRYAALREAARQHAAHRVALAHTADDQAETVLMRLLRGTGLTGLAAMAPSRPLGTVTVIRPLLDVWRSDITAYLTAHKLTCRTDASNRDPRFLRNRIRLHLLPLLARDYNPQIAALLVQLAQQCRLDVDWMQQHAQRQWKRLVKARDGTLAIRLAPFLRQPPAMQRHLVRLVIASLKEDGQALEFRHGIEIERLCRERPIGTIVDLPDQLQVERARDHVVFRLASTRAPARSRDDGQVASSKLCKLF